MLRSHQYWDNLDYEELEKQADGSAKGPDATQSPAALLASEKDEKVRKNELAKLQQKAKRKDRAAKVAALRAKRNGNNEDNVAAETARIEASKLASMSKQFGIFMKEREEAVGLLKRNNFDAAIRHLQESKSGIETLAKELEISFTQTETPRNDDNHGHSHSHGHDHGHGHQHSMSCSHEHGCSHGNHSDQSNETEEKKAAPGDKAVHDFSKLVRSAQQETQLLLGQSHLFLENWVEAVDAFRQVLIHDQSVGSAWVLRGKAFLEMGAPLLAQLHLSQSPVAEGAEHVKALNERAAAVARARQAHSLEENAAEEAAKYTDKRPYHKSVHKLVREGDRLHREGFHYSAAIKFAAARILLVTFDKLCRQRDEEEEPISSVLRALVLIGLAQTFVERETGYNEAIQYCTEALLLSPMGCELPHALVARALAHKALGQYSFAVEDINRAALMCKILQHDPTARARPRCANVPEIYAVSKEEGGESLAELYTRIEKEKTSCLGLWRQLGQVTLPRQAPGAGIKYPFISGVEWGADSPFHTYSSIEDMDAALRPRKPTPALFVVLVTSSDAYSSDFGQKILECIPPRQRPDTLHLPNIIRSDRSSAEACGRAVFSGRPEGSQAGEDPMKNVHLAQGVSICQWNIHSESDSSLLSLEVEDFLCSDSEINKAKCALVLVRDTALALGVIEHNINLVQVLATACIVEGSDALVKDCYIVAEGLQPNNAQNVRSGDRVKLLPSICQEGTLNLGNNVPEVNDPTSPETIPCDSKTYTVVNSVAGLAHSEIDNGDTDAKLARDTIVELRSDFCPNVQVRNSQIRRCGRADLDRRQNGLQVAMSSLDLLPTFLDLAGGLIAVTSCPEGLDITQEQDLHAKSSGSPPHTSLNHHQHFGSHECTEGHDHDCSASSLAVSSLPTFIGRTLAPFLLRGESGRRLLEQANAVMSTATTSSQVLHLNAFGCELDLNNYNSADNLHSES